MAKQNSKQLPDQTGAPEIISAVGRSWIAGLTWRSFAAYPTLSERREDAQALAAEWMVLRHSFDIIQAGFCPALKNRKPRGLYSLAAAIAEEYPQPWCGIFQLNEKSWWYIAVRDGQAILPDGDVVGSHAKVRTIQKQHESYADWNVHDGKIEDLFPLLEFSKKNLSMGKVKSVEPTPVWKALAFIFLVLIAIAGGVSLYLEHKHQVHKAAQKAFHNVMFSVSPLERTPAPDDWIQNCLSIVEPLKISENGWLASKASCSGNQATIIWERLNGATVVSRPAGVLSKDGNQVIQTQYFPSMIHGQDIIENYTLEDDALYRLMQPINVQVEIGDPIYNSGSGFEVQTVNFTLPFEPLNVDLNKVPGLRVDTLDWTESGWTIQGKLYGK